MYMYIYMHDHISIHGHATFGPSCIYTHRCTRVYVNMGYINTSPTYRCTQKHMCEHVAYLQACVRNMVIYTCIHTYMHTYMHACIHTY